MMTLNKLTLGIGALFACASISATASTFERNITALESTNLELRAEVHPIQECEVDKLTHNFGDVALGDFPLSHDIEITCSGGGMFVVDLDDSELDFSVVAIESAAIKYVEPNCDLLLRSTTCPVTGMSDGSLNKITVMVEPREDNKSPLGRHSLSIPVKLETRFQ